MDERQAVEALEAAAAAVLALKTEKDPDGRKAIWFYDNCVCNALRQYVSAERSDRRDEYLIIQKHARKIDSYKVIAHDSNGWTSYRYVAAVLDTFIAWSTPGFGDAKQYNDIYCS